MNVGVLGAGQLGRMLAIAGQSLDARFRFLDPNPDSPVRDVGELRVAPYDDAAELERFAEGLDVVTYEFESIPIGAVEAVAKHVPVFPPVQALRVAQDRVLEKRCFQHTGIRTAPSRDVASRGDLEKAAHEIGLPAVLKTRRFGYDGKGQVVVRGEDELAGAWDTLGGVPLILEQFVEFDRELSIIGARGRDGGIVFYPLVENEHDNGILACSFAPADVTDAKTKTACDYVRRMMSGFDYVGVLTLEMFESGDKLIANEIAPRVHNSGHWTIEGAQTSQFENHVRAIMGKELGPAAAVGHSVMLNVLGAAPDMSRIESVPDAKVHMYGKAPAPRRKLGHVTVCGDDPREVRERGASLRQILEPERVPA
ncbi:MAG TPA: 5-(carboxyamino)imidazole ribonucleotide synthase [Gemmatimonadaceae bacterium]|nr:5-(carboxyamino)imidazole ribonucleotide synthase [Gemmatimonadaceae bacterium]